MARTAPGANAERRPPNSGAIGQQQGMRRDPSARGPIIRQNEQPPDIRRPPPEAIGSDARRQSTFDVKVSERLLDRGELGLQLDDEQGSTWRVPAQQVDRPALAEDRIADFGHDGPAELFEPPREKHAEPGVPLVEQAVEIPAAPPHEHHDLRIHRLTDLTQDAD